MNFQTCECSCPRGPTPAPPLSTSVMSCHTSKPADLPFFFPHSSSISLLLSHLLSLPCFPYLIISCLPNPLSGSIVVPWPVGGNPQEAHTQEKQLNILLGHLCFRVSLCRRSFWDWELGLWWGRVFSSLGISSWERESPIMELHGHIPSYCSPDSDLGAPSSCLACQFIMALGDTVYSFVCFSFVLFAQDRVSTAHLSCELPVTFFLSFPRAAITAVSHHDPLFYFLY